METFELIDKVLNEISKEVGYCGSCMGGCDIKTRFICMGGSGDTINKWVQSHEDVVDKWDEGIKAQVPQVAQSAKRAIIMANIDSVINWISYVIKDINSYDELPDEWKNFLTPEVFNEVKINK